MADDRARYIDVNAAATTLTGYTRSELLRMSVWDLTPERNRKLGLTLWRAFLRAEEQRGTYRLTRKDSTLVAASYFTVAHVLPNVHFVGARDRRARSAAGAHDPEDDSTA